MSESMPTASETYDLGLRRPWRERLRTLKNVRPFLGLLWGTGPWLVVGYFAARLLRAAAPVAMLYITKLVIDAVVHGIRSGAYDAGRLWRLILIELTLA